MALTDVQNVFTFSFNCSMWAAVLKPAILWLEMEIRELLIFRSLGVPTVFQGQFSFLRTDLRQVGQVGNTDNLDSQKGEEHST